MGRSAGSLHSFFGLTFGLVVVVLAQVMASAAIAADYIPRGQPVPQNIRWTNTTPTGVGTRASASWTFNGTTTHHKFPVPVSSSTLGGLAGAAVRRGLPIVGWGLVLRDIINGAGWVIDELGQQVLTAPRPDGVIPPQGVWWQDADRPAAYTSPNAAASAQAVRVGATLSRVVCNSAGDQCFVYVGRVNGSGVPYEVLNGYVYRRVNTTSSPLPTNDAQPAVVSNQQLGDLVKSHPEVVNAILVDPLTGAPIRTQELVDALNALRASLEAANGVTEPGSDLLPSEDFAEPTPSQTDWPDFCNWATTVCEFMEWARAEDTPSDNPEVPWEEEPPTQSDWSSGLGGGTCPAPFQISVSLGGQVATPEFSYQPICDFATTMRPVVIALATILAAMIISGLRSTKDA